MRLTSERKCEGGGKGGRHSPFLEGCKKTGPSTARGRPSVQKSLPESRGARCSVTVTVIPFFDQKNLCHCTARARTTHQAQERRASVYFTRHSSSASSPAFFSFFVGFNRALFERRAQRCDLRFNTAYNIPSDALTLLSQAAPMHRLSVARNIQRKKHRRN